MQTPPLIPEQSNPQFDLFWKQYPKKESKLTAEKAFSKALRLAELPVLLKALETVKQTDQWKKGVIPLAASWLNQRRWLDTLTSTAAPENSKRELSPMEKQIHNGEYLRILEEIRKIKNSYDDHQDKTQKDKERLRVLVSRRNELRTMLGILV